MSPGSQSPPHEASQEPPNLTHAKPIFLHTGWRSSGTWLWAKLRADAGVFALYEPLHELLGSLNAQKIASNRSNSWASGHGQATPYFAEYGGLLKPAGGVSGFHGRFSYERYFLESGARDDELRAYIDGLLAAAKARQKSPVLKFCRSLGRTAWMQKQFPDALHAVVMRDPAAQFQSSHAQMVAGNRFFMMAPLLVLARNRDEPLVQEVTARLDVRLPALPARNRALDGELCWRYQLKLDDAARYRNFMAFWTATAITALAARDALIIDVDDLQAASQHRTKVEAAFRRAGTGLTLIAQTPAHAGAAPAGAGQIHAAALDLLETCGRHLSDHARAIISAKLAACPIDRAAMAPSTETWRDAEPASSMKRARQSLYFAAIGASMPFRRLHGNIKTARLEAARHG